MKDVLQQPIEYRYPSGERPTVAPSERLPDDAGEWYNCWDYNPFGHGGLFARWDGRQWEILEVTPPSAWPEDSHIFEWHGAHPSDVWADPDDPMTDWSDSFKRELSTLQNPPVHPASGEVFDSLISHVAHWAQHRGGHGRHDTKELDTPEEYWREVASYGVEPADLGHVDTDNIPDGLLAE